MNISINFSEASMDRKYTKVINTYTRGPLYCVLFIDEDEVLKVHKYPLIRIFRIIEDYE